MFIIPRVRHTANDVAQWHQMRSPVYWQRVAGERKEKFEKKRKLEKMHQQDSTDNVVLDEDEEGEKRWNTLPQDLEECVEIPSGVGNDENINSPEARNWHNMLSSDEPAAAEVVVAKERIANLEALIRLEKENHRYRIRELEEKLNVATKNLKNYFECSEEEGPNEKHGFASAPLPPIPSIAVLGKIVEPTRENPEVENGSNKVHGEITSLAEVEYSCTCGRRYATDRLLKDHVTQETMVKKFPCNLCRKRFFLHSELTHHKKRCHGTSDAATGVGCIECGLILPTRIELNSHKLNVHGAANKGGTFEDPFHKGTPDRKILQISRQNEGVLATGSSDPALPFRRSKRIRERRANNKHPFMFTRRFYTP